MERDLTVFFNSKQEKSSHMRDGVFCNKNAIPSGWDLMFKEITTNEDK